jgi:K+-sensing histidine kinase KdpD
MKPLETVYWLRFGFGILAALVSLGLGLATNAISKSPDSQTFFYSASLAIIVYILSYYFIRSRFALKVQKPQKLVTAGIGIYFLAWIVFWALFYTILAE